MPHDVDDSIVLMLVEEPRATVKRIAERTAMPESTARARLSRVIESGRARASVLVHPDFERQRLLYMLRIRCDAYVAPETLLRAPDLSASPWAARSLATGMLFVQLAAETGDEMLSNLTRARRVPGVDELTYSVVSRVYVGSSWRASEEDSIRWAASPTRAVDEIDRALISALRIDGRASYTELAAVAGLTVAATRRRVLRLVEDGVIRFATRVEDGASLGAEASVDLTVGALDVDAFIADAAGSTQVRYVIEQSGEYNLACYVVASDPAALAEAVASVTSDRRVRRHSVDPFLVLRDRLSWHEN